MAKVRNIGRQPMGFYDESGANVVVASGREAEIPMTDGYYAKLQSILEKCDPKPYELSGGAGGSKAKSEPSKAEPPKATTEPKKG
jgi:hypothetical protein